MDKKGMDLRGLLEFFAITWTAIEGTTDDVKRIEKEQTKLLDQMEERLAHLQEQPRECLPYCQLLKECMEILGKYPFKTPEADYTATKVKGIIEAIQEKKFERMYYDARKEIHRLLKQLDYQHPPESKLEKAREIIFAVLEYYRTIREKLEPEDKNDLVEKLLEEFTPLFEPLEE